MKTQSNRTPMSSRRMPPQFRRRTVSWREIVDILVLFIWGMMLLRFWFTGSINVLLHPDYMWLSNGAAIVLLGLGTLKLVQLLRGKGTADNNLPHFSLFPPAVSSAILLGVAVFGLIFTPRPFASETALARGVSDTVTATRSQPQQFGNFTRPEDRSLVGWIRTLNVYPEPDAYDGQAVNVDGFVVHTPDLPENYFTLTRFIITCCAADAYPVGLPVLLEQSRDTYAPDTWLQVQGNMKSETLNGERRLVIQAERLEQIPEPKNPYDY